MNERCHDCSCRGGCVSDYVVVGISCITFIFVCAGTIFIIIKRTEMELNAKRVSVLIVQNFASLVYLSSILMSKSVLRLSREHFWDSCYLWQIWLGGPLGFGVLISCHLVRAYRLYNVFVARRLPPLKSYQLIPPLLLPWFAVAGVLQGFRVFHEQSPRCETGLRWQVGASILHVMYPLMLLYGAWLVRHIRFKFDEFRELVKVAFVCGFLLVIWAGITIAEKVEEEKYRGFEVSSRFIILISVNIFVLSLFWIPLAKPVSDFLQSFREKKPRYSSMGQVLGVPHSGVVLHHPAGYDFSRPLECLLEDRRFRESYLKFAESRLASEVVQFYIEVRELNKLPANQLVQRVYMAEHIIDKYIKSGSPMEINLSYQMRMEIINTKDLAEPDLFKRAVCEALTMMQMNLSNAYWQSLFFEDLKSELEAELEAQYTDGLEQQSDVSSKRILRKLYDHADDDPFDQGCPFSSELCKLGTETLPKSKTAALPSPSASGPSIEL